MTTAHDPLRVPEAGPAGDPVRLARAYLLRVAEPPAPALAAFVGQCGAVEAARLVRTGTVPEPVREETVARHEIEMAEVDLARAESAGARLVIPEDDEWPSWPLLALDNAVSRGLRWAVAPLALWVRGTAPLAKLADPAVAIVGARAATVYGSDVAGEFGHDLAERGYAVVSGAAYGIDGAAHRGALAAYGSTVAVVACGVNVAYPAGHTDLLDRIAANGLVVSEYPPGTPPARHRFLVRNRLIAALGAGTVVVEAGRRSGARNTATTAAALGRQVLAVPGPITSSMSIGCHDLLRAGVASVVTSPEEVIEVIGPLRADGPAAVGAEARSTDGLSEAASRVHDALATRHPRHPERVAAESGVPLRKVRASLVELELTGLAECGDDGWRRTSAGGGGPMRT
ncbi:DNA processing protein [Herbihabitans rhizosphaerae]|uniref:DNA processing protein n=1 Tax=Herbihabitans rhizosphaerae TaxID=1872711 RepID=A0A4Q7KK96_9PSEU|nr:DNA-processing protein DprA [Herbihabitans rhizosphaerae]RZS34675.1 DNA processing protein [Herbihabitans rhizosphaerae]